MTVAVLSVISQARSPPSSPALIFMEAIVQCWDGCERDQKGVGDLWKEQWIVVLFL